MCKSRLGPAIRISPIFLYLFLFVTLPLQAAGKGPEHKPAPAVSMNLGAIHVEGERQVIETLQAIKIALNRPFSPGRAHENDVVCRIHKAMGRAVEYLDCATNRYYTARREITQTAMMVAESGVPEGAKGACDSSACYDYVFTTLSAGLSRIRGHQLHVQVNAGALKALLAKVPYPAPEVAPATPAPAAGTHH